MDIVTKPAIIQNVNGTGDCAGKVRFCEIWRDYKRF